MRRLSLAVAIFIGLITIATWWPFPWVNLDGDRMVQASRVFLDGGNPYGIPGYLYSPLAPILTAPLAVIPLGLALLALFKVELVAGYTWVRFGPILAVTVLLSPPIVSDLALGNVNLLLVAAAVWMISKNGLLPGAAFGLLFAAFPKPMFLPLLLWVLVFRRRASVGWIAGLSVATSIAMLVAGPSRYVEFVGLLLRGGDIGPHFVGNAGLSFDSPIAGLAVGLLAIGIFLWTMRFRDLGTSLLAAAVAGMLAGTYQPLYSAELLLGALPLYAALHPRRAPLVLAAYVGTVLSLPLAAVFTLVAVLIPRSRLETLTGPVRSRLLARKRPATSEWRH